MCVKDYHLSLSKWKKRHAILDSMDALQDLRLEWFACRLKYICALTAAALIARSLLYYTTIALLAWRAGEFCALDRKFNKRACGRVHLYFCLLGQVILDLLFSPVLVAGFLCSPVRAVKLAQTMDFSSYKQYSDTADLARECSSKRQLYLHSVLLQGLVDLMDVVLLAALALTVVRAPYLVRVCRRYGKQSVRQILAEHFSMDHQTAPQLKEAAHPKQPLSEAHSSVVQKKEKRLPVARPEQRIEDEKEARRVFSEQPVRPGVAFQSILQFCAQQLLMDVLQLPMALAVLLLSPWNARRMLSIYQLQFKVVSDTLSVGNREKIGRSRKECTNILGRIFTVEYVNICLLVFMVVTVTKIKDVVRFIRLQKLCFDDRQQLDFIIQSKLLRKHLLRLAREQYSWLVYLFRLAVIFVLQVRFRRTMARIRRFTSYSHQIERIRLANDRFLAENKRSMRTLNHISNNIFSVIIQFLDVDDLARLQQASRRLYSQCKVYEQIYETLWKNKWELQKPPGWQHNENYKMQCINMFRYKVMHEPIDEARKDRIYGLGGIVAEEMIKSLLDIPHIFTLPLKLGG